MIMKKNVCTFLLAFLAFGLAASAQTERGSWLVGGNVELNTAKNTTVVGFTPMAGYFLINNLAVGANIDYDYRKSADGKQTAFGIGPFARYYLGTMNIRPFAHANVNFTSTNTKVGTQASSTATGSDLFLGGGLAGFINRNVALEGLIGYTSNTIANQGSYGGFGLKIGFQVYLSRYQVESLKTGM